MTYQQIELTEHFIAEAISIKDKRPLFGEELYNESIAFETKVKASGVGYKGEYIYWENTEEWSNFDENNYSRHIFHDEKIKANLNVITSELEGLLKAIPNYGLLCDIRKEIKSSHNLKIGKKYSFIVETVAKYDGKINFGKVVLDYIKNEGLLLSPNTEPIFNGVVEKLKHYMQELCEEKKPVRANSGKSTTTNIHISQQQQNTQTATATQNISMTFEDCFKSLDDCETLNEADLREIKQQITELQDLLKDSKGKKKTIREKVSSLLKWIADKGTDVMIAVLPSILAGLQKM